MKNRVVKLSILICLLFVVVAMIVACKPTIYEITFKADGVVVDTLYYTAKDNEIIEPQVPNKIGYDGKWKQYTLAKGDITVNAVYTAKQYQVTLNYNGATENNTQISVAVTYDQTIGTLPAPIKDGYIFDGWYYGEDKITSQSIWTIDSSEQLEFTAKWTIKQCTVNFNSNGGSEVPSITNVEYNSVITKPAYPTKKGCEFIGWYKDADLNSVWDFNKDTVLENITLYAKWLPPTEGLVYELNPDGNSYAVIIQEFEPTDENIIIAHEYNGKPVTVIGVGAFGFGLIQHITNVFIPDTVIRIDDFAFMAFVHITSVNIPSSVKKIGNGAFACCWSLESLTVDVANTIYHSEGNCIIETQTKTLIVGCKTSVIPNDGSVTKIEWAFYNSNIATIEIPDTITEIGEYAFRDSAIIHITIPHSVTKIADNAFGSSWLLEVCNNSQLDIEKGSDTYGSVAKFAKNVYSSTDGRSNITITDNGLMFYDDDDGAVLLRYLGNKSEVVMPQDFNGKEYTFDHLTFGSCFNLQTITIPDFVSDLRWLHFPDIGSWSADSYRNIVARETHPLYSSENGVLYNKNKTEIVCVYREIEELTIFECVTSIDNNAFKGGNSLNAIYYIGTTDDWAKINIGYGNDILNNVIRYYYSETEPELNSAGTAYDGNYWYYNDDNEIVVWVYNKENN